MCSYAQYLSGYCSYNPPPSCAFGCARATKTFSRVVWVKEYSATPSCSLLDSKAPRVDGRCRSCIRTHH